MELLYVAVAFVLGLAARALSQPPLVGFLAAGFALHAGGYEDTPVLAAVSDIGVQLLLFTIGVKLDLRLLARPVIWAGTTVHMALTIGLSVLACGLLFAVGVLGFADLDLTGLLVLAFALSFSSTVFAVKILDQYGASGSFYGRLSVGILIIQDIAAVVLLTISKGHWPSPWALLLAPALPILARLLHWLLARVGHGELFVLLGILLAAGGVTAFEAVGLKGDLGALVAGLLVAGHPKAAELARTLMGFKELFLVGFFLRIGLLGLPDWEAAGVAVLLLLLLPLKVGLYLAVLTRLRVRARTALLTGLGLGSYSEFGLIVASVAVPAGWIGGEWLVPLAVAVAASFVLAAPLVTGAEGLYRRFHDRLIRLETKERLPEEQPVDTGACEVLILGMGRVGAGAYDAMRGKYGDRVLGADADPNVVSYHEGHGRNVILADATDSDLWRRVRTGRLRIAMLALPRAEANVSAAEQLSASGFSGFVAATYKYDDELEGLLEAGVHVGLNLYAEAGDGFAEIVATALESPAFGALALPEGGALSRP